MKYTEAASDDLIASIYEGIFAEGSWKRFLDKLCDSVPGAKASLVLNDGKDRRAYAIEASGGWEDGAIEQYNTYYSALNPLPWVLGQREVGIAYPDTEMIPLGQFSKTEIFNDFLLPNEVDSAVGINLSRHDRQSVVLGINAPRGAMDSQGTAAQLTRLAPHLQRALRHYREVKTVSQAWRTTSDLFDAVGIGMMALGEGAKVIAISDTMSRLLSKASPIEASPLGTIRLRIAEAQAALQTMLGGSRGNAQTAPAIADYSWGELRLTLVRIKREAMLPGLECAAAVVLLQHAGGPAQHFDVQRFAARYHLTKAESRALSGIVKGHSVDRIAQDAYVSRETIRSQIKSLYAKTGVNSMADIIRLALSTESRIGQP
ncbi:hypothetical protein FX016_24245 [Cupriavidus gilardii]|nr:hypothetical protein FX016_24245 [Cupriavidus gilardii]